MATEDGVVKERKKVHNFQKDSQLWCWCNPDFWKIGNWAPPQQTCKKKILMISDAWVGHKFGCVSESSAGAARGARRYIKGESTPCSQRGKLKAMFFPIAMFLLPNFLELRFFQLLCFFFTISGVSIMHKRNIKGGDSSFPIFEIHGFQLLCFGKS